MLGSINIDYWGRPSAFLSYGLALLAVPAATIIQHFGDMHFAVTPSFFCAVMLSAWFGGFGPGLLAIALSVLSLKHYFVPPTGTFAISTAYIPSLILFSQAALFVTWLSVKERNATKSLVHARDQLDLKLHELEKSNESLKAEIAARARAEEELDQLRSELAHVTRVTTLGELTASLAHEVNQPLAAVVGHAGACLHWLDPGTSDLDEARRAAESIIEAGNRAAEVIGHVRALAKKANTQKSALDINSVVNEVITLVQRELFSHRVSLRTEFTPALPMVLADRVQLQQVIINLVMNGVEAMQPITTRPRQLVIRSNQDEGREVLVTVEDCGVGISAENADRLFNPFFTTKSSGLGMGLSICRSIIESHGGRMSAANNGGPGATFQFTLPLHQENASSPDVQSPIALH